MKSSLSLLVVAVALAGGCVNTTTIELADGTFIDTHRNPALLDGCQVTNHWYSRDDGGNVVTLAPPSTSIGPSIVGQLWGGFAYVWGQHERSRQSSDQVNVNTGSVTAIGEGGSGGAGGVGGDGGSVGPIDIDVHGPPEPKDWPKGPGWPDGGDDDD
jgi:hypothetical protein